MTKKEKADHARAGELMEKYTELMNARTKLLGTIMEELTVKEKEMKEAQTELIEIGERCKHLFDEKSNWDFETGYLHIAKNTVVKTTRKFDLSTFAKERPEMINVTLKVNPIKKAFLDNAMRKELKSLGVNVDTADTVQVLLKKLEEVAAG